MNTIDLQVHSSHSDGVLTPSELIRYAASQGIKALALVDHDTVSGLDEAAESSIENHVELIPGVEITTGDASGEYHILGYYIDWKDPEFLESIACLWGRRQLRNERILRNLRSAGFTVTAADVERTVKYKMHDRKDIALTLVALGQVKSVRDAFSDNLLGEKSPLYVPQDMVRPDYAIMLIRKAFGVPVLAHPGVCPGGRADAYPIPKSKILEFSRQGLQGLEVYYSQHSRKMVQDYLTIANDLNLVVTGGSDFHRTGEGKPRIGETDVPEVSLDILKDVARKNHST